jgi:hypothetical protein
MASSYNSTKPRTPSVETVFVFTSAHGNQTAITKLYSTYTQQRYTILLRTTQMKLPGNRTKYGHKKNP